MTIHGTVSQLGFSFDWSGFAWFFLCFADDLAPSQGERLGTWRAKSRLPGTNPSLPHVFAWPRLSLLAIQRRKNDSWTPNHGLAKKRQLVKSQTCQWATFITYGKQICFVR